MTCYGSLWALVSFFTFSVFASADVVTFDASSDLNNFSPSFTPIEFGWSSSGGLNGSGSLTSAGNDTFYMTDTVTSLNPQASDQIGLYFQYQGVEGTPSDLRLGFVEAGASSNPKPALLPSLYAEFAVNGITLLSGSSYVDSNSFQGGLTNSNWYYAQFTLTEVAVVTPPSLVKYNLVANLYQADSSGNLGSLVGSESTTLQSTVFQSTLALNGFIGSRDPNAEFSNADNLTIQTVPEPSDVILIFMGGLVLIGARRIGTISCRLRFLS